MSLHGYSFPSAVIGGSVVVSPTTWPIIPGKGSPVYVASGHPEN